MQYTHSTWTSLLLHFIPYHTNEREREIERRVRERNRLTGKERKNVRRRNIENSREVDIDREKERRRRSDGGRTYTGGTETQR